MKRIIVAAVLLCTSVTVTRAQTPLSATAVAGDLEPGVSHSFTALAAAGLG